MGRIPVCDKEKQQIALVTGAGRGIGRATALALARCGLNIAVHDIDEKSAIQTANAVKKMGSHAQSYIADIADAEAMFCLVKEIESTLGGIDILINNAGVSSDRCEFEQVSEQMFRRSIEIHVGGTLFTTQAVIPGMKQRKFGRIVNTSSIQAMVGWANGTTYNAAKGAIIAMSRGWAKEFARWNICVNVIAPGHIETDMTLCNDSSDLRAQKAKTIPLGRYGTAEEVAAATVFLVSKEASFITGQILSPNGGFVIV